MKNFICILLLFNSILLFSQTIIVDESFDNPNEDWTVEKKSDVVYSYKKGNYMIVSKEDNNFWSTCNFNKLNINEDFTIETAIMVKSKNNAIAGLIWDKSSTWMEYVLIQGNRIKIMGKNLKKNTETAIMDWREVKWLNPPGSYNTLKIEKKANVLVYYVNDQIFFHDGENETIDYYGKSVGFSVEGKAELNVDYLKITNFPATKVKTIDNLDLSLKLEKLDSNINSSNRETLPRISPDGNYLYCIRRSKENVYGSAEFDDIWYSKKDENGRWSKLSNIGSPLNNEAHNFVVSISPDNNSLLVANAYNSDGSPNGDGFSITRKLNGKFQVPEYQRIMEFSNKSETVSYFLCTDNKTLLLAVETEEGLGNKDIYVSFYKTANLWTKPKSLGSVINTPGDEHSPYLSADGKSLFFSSTGHYGYGNYDVFVSQRLDESWDNWSEPRNLGPNINSEAKETGYFMAAVGDYAYLSSDGDICRIKNPAFIEPVIILSGKVFDKKTGQPIGAAITYSNLSDDKTLGTANSDNVTGDYKIVLQKGKAYGFMANKNDYYSISENIDLTDLKEYKEIKKDLYLSPIVRGEPIRLNNIFFEFAKSVLKDESFPELDRLVGILSKNPELKIEIAGHTDDVGTDASNQTLSQDRAQSVVNYLLSKGIKPERLSAKGYGESKPDVPNNSDENRAFNRRVEFKIL